MAHKNKVMRSVNAPDRTLCVDVFLRPDGTYGFEEYRRDAEDPSGWFPIGQYGDQVFETETAAWSAARAAVGWLSP